MNPRIAPKPAPVKKDGYAAASGLVIFTVFMAGIGFRFFVDYDVIRSVETGSRDSGGIWTLTKLIHTLAGTRGVFVAAVAAMIVAVGAGFASWRKFRATRAEMGDDRYDEMRLKREVAERRKRFPSREIPAHLESVAALRAYERRIRNWWIVLIAVFAAVGAAGAMGLLTPPH